MWGGNQYRKRVGGRKITTESHVINYLYKNTYDYTFIYSLTENFPPGLTSLPQRAID